MVPYKIRMTSPSVGIHIEDLISPPIYDQELDDMVIPWGIVKHSLLQDSNGCLSVPVSNMPRAGRHRRKQDFKVSKYGSMSREMIVNGKSTKEGTVILFDATDDKTRGIKLQSEPTIRSGGKAMLFAGKKLREPVAWRGPIVMNTQQEIQATFKELRSGRFPPVRVDWDYKRIAARPSTKLESEL